VGVHREGVRLMTGSMCCKKFYRCPSVFLILRKIVSVVDKVVGAVVPKLRERSCSVT
jgi:hypothetical protein